MSRSRTLAALGILLAGLTLLPSIAMAQDSFIAFYLTFNGHVFDGYHATEGADLLLEPSVSGDPWIESGGHILGWYQGSDHGLVELTGIGGFQVKSVKTYDPVTHCYLTGANLATGELVQGDTVAVSVNLDWNYCAVGVDAHSVGGGTGSFEVTGGSADVSFGGTVDSGGGITYTHLGAHSGAIPHDGTVSISFFPDAFSVVQAAGRTSAIGHGIQIDTIANTTIGIYVTFFRPPDFTVTLGGNTPTSGTVAKGSSHVPMLEFTLNPASAETINSVTLQGHGTGDESVDVNAVSLYRDVNGNGHVDAGDSLLATGTYPGNDASVTLAVSPAYAINGPTNLLVTYSFSTTIAQRVGGGLSLALLGLCFVPTVRRRRRLILGMLMLVGGFGLSSCGGGGSPTGPGGGGGSSTYQVELKGVSINNVAVAESLTGATVTVQK